MAKRETFCCYRSHIFHHGAFQKLFRAVYNESSRNTSSQHGPCRDYFSCVENRDVEMWPDVVNYPSDARKLRALLFEVKIKEKEIVKEGILHWERVIEVLKRLIEICVAEESMLLRTHEKDRFSIKQIRASAMNGRKRLLDFLANFCRSSISEQSLVSYTEIICWVEPVFGTKRRW